MSGMPGCPGEKHCPDEYSYFANLFPGCKEAPGLPGEKKFPGARMEFIARAIVFFVPDVLFCPDARVCEIAQAL